MGFRPVISGRCGLLARFSSHEGGAGVSPAFFNLTQSDVGRDARPTLVFY